MTWRVRGHGRTRKPGEMNKTEAEYGMMIHAEWHKGAVLWWGFEQVTLKIGPNCRYNPDFVLMRSNGQIEFHEVKGGFIRDDSMVKLKAAAEKFPFVFKLAQKKNGRWTVEEI